MAKAIVFSFVLSCGESEQIIDVKSVSISQVSADLSVGESLQLKADILPKSATDKDLHWASSKPSIASVTQDGLVFALAEGSTSITATSSNGVFGSCSITVTKRIIKVESIALNESILVLQEGEQYELRATITPDNATDKSIIWSTSDANVASVDNAGKIHANKAGDAVIIAKVGEMTAECKVTVLAKKINVSKVLLNRSSLDLMVGDQFALIPTIVPSNATVQDVEWSTSDASIASVSEGLVVAVSEGTATIVAYADEKTAECIVSVKSIPVESITLDKSILSLYEGESYSFTASIIPQNATYQEITWRSSDDTIASIEDGVLYAKTQGSATIIATANGKSAQCQVEVLSSVYEISLNKKQLDLIIGDTEKLEVVLMPEGSTPREKITWTTTDEKIALVDQEGNVMAIKEGSVIVTAMLEGKKAECRVNVDYIRAESIQISHSEVTLYKGSTITLTANIYPDNVTYDNYQWHSSNPSVATVDDSGTVNAVGAGTADITVSLEGITATCHILVVVPVSSLSLNKSSLKLQIGSAETLVASILPSDATDKTVTWESSDTSVATVDGNGQVTAIGGGAATISARAGAKVALCNVTVPFPVEHITLSHSEVSLYVGRVLQLSASVYPQNAEYDTIEWNSTNPDVASVSSNGAVTAKSKGTATITASCNGVTAQCVITVLNALKGLSFEFGELSIFTGCSEQLSLILDPVDATLRSAIVWSSSDNSTVSVSDKGVITGLQSGSAWVTAQVDGCHAECLINVRDKVTGLVLNKEFVTMKKGDSFQLSYQVIPSGANPEGDLFWTSSNPDVAIVNNNGKVDAIAEGEAIITISLNESISASCKITVVIPVSSIQINQSSVTLNKGKTAQLSAVVLPLNATDNHVNWGSDNPQVATVSNSGLVTAVSGGTTKIKAHAGGKTAECEITVLVPVTSFSINPVSLTLKKGSSYALRAIITPSDATDQSVTWSSTNKNVVTVDENGLLWAAGGGFATIQASIGSFRAECAVQVTVDVSAVTLDSSSLLIHRGKSHQLIATVLPSDATDKSITWTSSNLSVATVSNGLICAVGRGTTVIQARVGNKYATCSVTVDVPVEAITLDKKELKLNPANSYTLKATVIPYDADIGNGIVWLSTVPEVAKVNSEGVVTAESEGITFISATLGNVSASCVVTCERVSGDNEETGNENWK